MNTVTIDTLWYKYLSTQTLEYEALRRHCRKSTMYT